MQVAIHLNDSWTKFGSTMTRGYAYFGKRLFNARSLARFFAHKQPIDIASAIGRANGFFGLVSTRDNWLVASVDRIRSIPLFYGFANDCAYVSDDAYWVSEQVLDNEYDELSVAEFLSLGNVTGKDTLGQKVKQLQAGEMIFVGETAETRMFRTKRYYRYLHHDYFKETKKSLLTKWDGILLRAFERLIRSLDGRPIVVPLSGGYDSRLIALMLRRIGYENVICFTYGTPGYWEAKIAQDVARQLDYQWEFIPYSHRLWYQFCRSKQYKRLVRYADGMTSVTLLQDWPALRELQERKSVPKNSVIVPGHGIRDLEYNTVVRLFLSTLTRSDAISNEQVADMILKDYYNLWDLSRLDGLWRYGTPVSELRLRLKGRLLNTIKSIPCGNTQDAANLFENWAWQELQAKFIVNSIRVYEFLGYEWRLPLWDAEIMSFCERVPVDYTLREELFINHVNRIQSSLGIRLPGRDSSNIQKQVLSATNLIKPLTRLGLVDKFGSVLLGMRKLSYKWAYQSDPHARYGMIPLKKFRRLYGGKPANAYSFLALDRLGIISL